jgi:hypothetical protein
MKLSLLSRTFLPGLSLLPAALLGCSAQAGPAYEGEPLLTLRGKVTIDNPEAPDSLVPALAFYGVSTTNTQGWYDVVDVDVQGDFPSNFSLDVLKPPPKDAQWLSGMAVGYITAVPPDHAQRIESPLKFDELVKSGCLPLPGADGGSAASVCTREYMRCEPSNAPQIVDETTGHCYHDVFTCDADFLHCTPDHAWGDPTYAKDMWQDFAGLSRNYLVVYTPSFPPANSDATAMSTAYFSWVLNEGRPFDPGYHLVQAEKLSEEEVQSALTCVQKAQDDAAAAYNAAHGTTWTADGRDPQPDDAASSAISLATVKAEIAGGCKHTSVDGFWFHMVPSGTAHPITVDIGTDVRPSNLGTGPF